MLRPARLLVLPLLLAALAALAAPAAAGVYAGLPVVGPSPALRTLAGLDLAPDGTGAMVFTMQDGGVEHVFLSRLLNGSWGAPERVDAGLAAASAQPAVAAADGGRVAVAFVNAGNVYVVTRAAAGAAPASQALWSRGGASSPAVDISVNGKGYLVFTAPGAGGHDVRAAFSRDGGAWALAGAPLDAQPGADAGPGASRARVSASADGVGVAVWGEQGRVYARRIRGTSPSVTFADASAGLALEGVAASAADEPVVSAPDDDSFVAVAFRASFQVAGGARSRVVYRRLRGSRFEGPVAVDALPFASGKASDDPHVVTVGTGQGIALASGATSFLGYAMLLRADAGSSAAAQIDTLAASAAPTHAVPAAATARKMLVAWQLTPSSGAAAIHGRYFADTAFEAEQVLSQPQYGPALAERGLLAAGDDAGDLVVAYVQDVPGAGPAISVAAVDQPPGRFAVKRNTRFQRTARPLLAWSVSRELWGRYFRVTIDGVPAGLTGRRAFRPRAPLGQGVHLWQVTVLDRRGQQFTARAARVRVDTLPAAVRTRVSGARRAGATLRLSVQASDEPPLAAVDAPPVATSGVKAIVVDWGDRTREPVRVSAGHVYARPGRYALGVTVTDRAGNRTVVRQRLKIAKPPKRRHRHR